MEVFNMGFTECVKERLALTLRSGLLCAVVFIPAATLAQSPETTRGDRLATVETASEAKTIRSRAVGATPATQRQINQLSSHIQRRYKVSEPRARRIVTEAIHNGQRHQLEPELILAIIAVESTFNERAVSRAGARGLMQVMPRYHRDKVREIGGTQALFDPAKNIHTGSRILAKYRDNHSGNLRRALLSYNGSLHLRRSSYADKVMRVYRDMRRVTVEG
jgi:soluble lytic murein transglycosylase-like protein